MPIEVTPFGNKDGRPVLTYCLKNRYGLQARLINYGARLTEMWVPDSDGDFADIVLGFDSLADYVETDTFFGATCGRYGNRIAKGQFALGDKPYDVSCNEHGNHLHGGAVGFDQYVWEGVVNEAENSVTFSMISPDGDQGFPGQVSLTSKYTLTDDNELIVTMTGITDRPTLLNLVHHSYWNIGGHDSGSVCDHLLTVDADFYTPVDEELLATGEILPVSGTPFDFRNEKLIGRDLESIVNAGFGRLTESAGGYDHNWVLRDFPGGLRRVATMWDPKSGRSLSISTTEPGVQVYTGGYLNEDIIGKGGHAYCRYAGVTFETQKFPGSPNFSHFPSTTLEPGEVYDHRMVVRFNPA